MLILPLAEFHITNTCNFNCEGCNRFNNYAFVGSQRWQDYADVYHQWSKIIKLEKFGILGGEPMLNPTYLEWIEGIAALWPNTSGTFTTNGYYLKSTDRDLYNIINSTNGRVVLEISLHNYARKSSMLSLINDWLEGDVVVSWLYDSIESIPGATIAWKSSYEAIKDPSWPYCDKPSDWYSLPKHIQDECKDTHQFSPDIINERHNGLKVVDSNGVTVWIKNEDFFGQAAIIHNANDTFSLHNSDPELAHNICAFKRCHQFIKGKLYKCAPVALFSEFDQQFNMQISDAERTLIESYQGASITWPYSQIEKFIGNLENSIPQCRLCPSTVNIRTITAEHGKKISVIRKAHD